jgi:hypothetical protein
MEIGICTRIQIAKGLSHYLGEIEREWQSIVHSDARRTRTTRLLVCRTRSLRHAVASIFFYALLLDLLQAGNARDEFARHGDHPTCEDRSTQHTDNCQNCRPLRTVEITVGGLDENAAADARLNRARSERYSIIRSGVGSISV